QNLPALPVDRVCPGIGASSLDCEPASHAERRADFPDSRDHREAWRAATDACELPGNRVRNRMPDWEPADADGRTRRNRRSTWPSSIISMRNSAWRLCTDYLCSVL